MWQLLRTLHHKPPGRAAKGHRRDTFSAALEQAEQLFAAAETVGAASRPILIFYGVSQLGRAVAAASMMLSNREYRLSGHGISNGPLEGAATGGLASLLVQGRQDGAFPTVAKTLAADSIQQEQRLGDIWGLIPDAERFELPGAGRLLRLTLRPESPHLVRSQDWGRFILDGLPLSLLQAEDEEPVTSRGPELAQLLQDSQQDASRIALQRRRLQAWLRQYPTLQGWKVAHYLEPEKPTGFRLSDSGRTMNVPLRLPKRAEDTEEAVWQARSFSYHSVMSVFPTLDGRGLAAHPFILWWAVLYVLSRLARYEPRDWVQMIDVTRSPDAAAIEYLLSEALLALPEVAYSCLIQVSAEA
jgi:hypothetical protein